MSDVFVNDVGTEVILDVGATISDATVTKIRAKMPGGGIKVFNATLNSSTSIKYVLAEGDLNVPGNWQAQAYIEMPGWKGRGEWANITVKD